MNPSPPPLPPTPAPGWWARHWKWCVPLIVVTAVGSVVGFVVLVISLVFGAMKSSEPCRVALAKAKADPQVQAALGTPVKDGFLMTGSINTSGSSGNAVMEIPISGPVGKGRIFLEARKSASVWTYSTLQVEVDGKADRIDLKP